MVMALLLAIPMVLVDDDGGGDDTGCVLHRCTGGQSQTIDGPSFRSGSTVSGIITLMNFQAWRGLFAYKTA